MSHRLPLALVSSFLFAIACAPPDGEGECASSSDCEADADAPCSGCPSLAAAICADGICGARGDDEVAVVADVNLDRGIAASVASFVHVIASATAADGPLDCANAFAGDSLAPGVNVLAAGYKSVSGGSFHEGITFGRVPAGDVAVLAWATDENAGDGSVLGTGCASDVSAAGTETAAGILNVGP